MTENRRLARALLVRTSDDLALRIETVAAARGVSSASWLRELAADAVAATEPLDRQRSPRRQPRPDLAPAEQELRAIVRDLGRTGGLLKLLVQSLREGGHPAHGETEYVLAEVQAATKAASVLVDRLR